MSNARDRQLQREDDDIDHILARLCARKGKPNRAQSKPSLPRASRAVATQEHSAYWNRYMEPIVSAEHKDPKTGEIKSIVQTRRVGTLVDEMHGNKTNKEISMEEYRAFQYLGELASKVNGHSQGVSSYGERIEASPPSQRCLTSDERMTARKAFEAGCNAMFGVECADGQLEIDFQEAHVVLKAMEATDKAISKKWVGAQLTHYTGAGQQQACGYFAVKRALRRLAIHFGFIKPQP